MSTFQDLSDAGVRRVRKAVWADDDAYLLIDQLPGGTRGPWLHLFDRRGQEICDAPTPQHLFMINFGDEDDGDWFVYTGPLDPADKAPGDPEEAPCL